MPKKHWIHDLCAELAGVLLYAVGAYTFALQGGFATGGVTGVALILNQLHPLPIGTIGLLLNIPIVLATFSALGRSFFLKSLRSMLLSALATDYLLPLFPCYQGDPLLAAVFSGLFMGAGLSLIYVAGSSTGGMDFLIHATKRRFPHASFGQITLLLDGLVILLGIPTFGNINAALYGMISAFALTITMDKIIYGAGSGKLALIVTDHGAAVARAIDESIDRGSTLVQVKGAYSGAEKQMVLCACSNNEVFRVRTTAAAVDKGAMVMICEANEVFGEGFHAHENPKAPPTPPN